MTVNDLLSELRERGVQLKVEGDRLRCIAERGTLTPELSERIKAHKSELMALLESVASNGAGADTSEIPPAPDRTRYGLSVTQHRASVSARDGGVVGTCYRMRGPLDADVLRATLEHIVARHPTLRTRFFLDRSPPEQEVATTTRVDVPLVTLDELPENERESKLLELLAAARKWRFDVTALPPFRFQLVRLSSDHHVLVTAFSPLTWDGWSFDVFWNELRHGYAALVQGRAWPLPDPPIAYADYVAWQERNLRARDDVLSRFWRERLGEELPPIPLLTDRPRPRLGANRGDKIKFDLPAQTTERVRAFSRRAGATPQMVMLAALYTLLNRISREPNIVVGCPVEARVHASTEVMIGPFVNMLLLPMQVDGTASFLDFATRVRDECLSAYDHQEYPIERLRVRSRAAGASGIAPAFQVEFSYQQVSQRGSEMGPLTLSQLELGASTATNDVTLWVKDWGDRIAGQVEYKPELFDRETVAHWFRCYTQFLGALLEAPTRPMDEVDVFGAETKLIAEATAKVLAAPPDWLAPELARLPAGSDAVTLRVVDARGLTCLLGAPGRVELALGGVAHATNLTARLTHEGRLLPVVPEASQKRERPPYAAPRTDLETQLAELFSTLLGESQVGATDDYFDLGGNSLLAVRLFGEIQTRFGVRLPLTTLLDAGTPRKLAEVVLRQHPDRESCLVKLRSGGAGRPVFLVHDGDGETLLYVNLARRLPVGIPVYGIEPLRAGVVPMVHTTVEDAARHYVSEMRRVQPEGPYVVGGLCAGGLISYEIARQLREAGQEIGLVALIEAAPPYAKKRVTRSGRRWQRFSALSAVAGANGVRKAVGEAFGKLGNVTSFELKRTAGRFASATKLFLLRNVYKGGQGWPGNVPPPTVRETYAGAERAFQPRPIDDVTLTVYAATSGTGSNEPFCEILSDPLFDWQGLSRQSVVRVDVPGGHSTMLQEPNVEVLARHMSGFLADANGASPRGSDGEGLAPDDRSGEGLTATQ